MRQDLSAPPAIPVPVAAEHRPQPRISVAMLSEYLDACPSRRHEILHGQKHPAPYIVALYGRARHAIVTALVAGARKPDEFTALTRDWYRTRPRSRHAERARDLSALAIADFALMVDTLGLADVRCFRIRKRFPSVTVEGVRISVDPDVALLDGDRQVGMLRLHFAKTRPPLTIQGELSAHILFEYAEEMLSHISPVHRGLCPFVDVFGGRVFTAPPHTRHRKQEVLAACREIAALWTAV